MHPDPDLKKKITVYDTASVQINGVNILHYLMKSIIIRTHIRKNDKNMLPNSKAKYSAVVRTIQWVIIHSIVGSFSCKRAHQRTHFMNAIQTLYYWTYNSNSYITIWSYADFKLYQVQEERHTLHGAIFLKIMCEKLFSLHIYNHSYKYNGKIVLFSIL